MIYVLAPLQGLFGIGDFVKTDLPPLESIVAVKSYEDAFAGKPLPVGAYIFAGLDQLTQTEMELVTRLHGKLAEVSPALPRLNHPARWRRRGDLLNAAFEAGINTFRSTRVSAPSRGRRFPVFLRSESQHTGSLSPLLHDAVDLWRAVVAALLRGHRFRDLLVVEYCDTADGEGVFRKYSAMVVGPHIVPRSLTMSRAWVTKVYGRFTHLEAARAEREYVESNPHEQWLRGVVQLGGVEYGRIDYGALDGRPQLWEINTNPTIGANLAQPIPNPWSEAITQHVVPGNTLSYEKIGLAMEDVNRSALAALEAAGAGFEPLLFPVSAAEHQRLRHERARRDRFLANRTVLGVAVAPLRSAYRAVRRAVGR